MTHRKLANNTRKLLGYFVFSVFVGLGAPFLPNAFAANEAQKPVDKNLTEAQRQEVAELVKKLSVEQPEIIVAALQNYKARAAEKAEKSESMSDKYLTANREAIERDPNDAVMGNPKGKITLVEYFDYRCGYCKAMIPVLQQALAAEPQLRLVLKQFPILSAGSVLAAKAVMAARAQSAAKEIALHERLMASKGRFSEDEIMEDAKAVGLDVEALRREMGNPRYSKILSRTAEQAEGLAIQGTPGFVIGRVIIRGAVDEASLTKSIHAAP